MARKRMTRRRRNPPYDADLVRAAALGGEAHFKRLVASLAVPRPESAAWFLVVREWVRLDMIQPFLAFMKTRQKPKIWLARLLKGQVISLEWVNAALDALGEPRFVGHWSPSTPYLDFDYEMILVWQRFSWDRSGEPMFPAQLVPGEAEAELVESADPEEDSRRSRRTGLDTPLWYYVYQTDLNPEELVYSAPDVASSTGMDEDEVEGYARSPDPNVRAQVAWDAGAFREDNPLHINLKDLTYRYALEIQMAEEWRKRGSLGRAP